MYASAPCHRQIASRLEILGEGRARATLDVIEEHFHAAMAVHGSFYFKLLDDAAFFAANSVVEDVFVVTASFNVQLMRPIQRGTMIAEGQVVRAGKTMIFADSILRDADGKELARGTGVFARSQVRLSDIEGYTGAG